MNSMSDKRALIALGAIVTLAAILGISQVSTALYTPLAATGILGHVTITAADADGNIKAYRQMDNIVVNQGFACGADLMFGTSFTPSGCNADIDIISINEQVTQVMSGDSAILRPISTETGTTMQVTSGAVSGTAELTVTKTFAISSSTTVGTTGLLSGATLFAGQTVGSPIPVGDGDSVTINWEVDVT